MFIITTPQQFQRQASKFFRKHSELKTRFAGVIADLRQDSFQTHLVLHPLSGKLDGCHAISLTYSFRISMTFLITDREIIPLDIGSHE